MPDLLDILWQRRWWSFIDSEDRLHAWVYAGLNVLEALAWLVLAGLVLLRWRRHRRSPLELAYAFAFLTFALTDLREAYALDSWLVWVKLANLVALLWLRRLIMRRHYPAAKVF